MSGRGKGKAKGIKSKLKPLIPEQFPVGHIHRFLRKGN